MSFSRSATVFSAQSTTGIAGGRWLATLVLALVVSLWPSRAFSFPGAGGSPTFRVIPIELMTYEGRTLKVGFELPCGAEAWGVLASATHRTGALRLAIVAKVQAVACTGLPQRMVETLDFVSTVGYRDVGPFDVDGVKRIKVIDPNALAVLDGTPAPALEASWDHECGTTLGAVLRRTSASGEIEVAVAETPRANPAAACVTEERQVLVPGVDLTATTKVRPYSDNEATSVERAMYLRLAKVLSPGIERVEGVSGSTSLRFERRCNEAPVGIVVTGRVMPTADTKASIRTPKIAVGVLVARYYNFICPRGEDRVVTDTITSTDLSFDGVSEVRILPPTRRSDGIQVRQPRQYAVMDKNRGVGLVLDLGLSCATQVGAVYGRDAGGNLAVGVVEMNDDPFACSEAAGKGDGVSIVQPFARKPHGIGTIFPMRIKGA